MLHFNRMPRIIQKPIVGPESNTTEKVKPTLDNMNELYKLYCSSEIPHFPASAATEAAKKRTEELEKYIKANNLDISVQNLEMFFVDVKNNMKGGILGSQAYLNARFNDYIENGYNPELKLDRPNGSDTEDNGTKPNLDDILAMQADIEKGFRFGIS